jgi:hypothetical protein
MEVSCINYQYGAQMAKQHSSKKCTYSQALILQLPRIIFLLSFMSSFLFSPSFTILGKPDLCDVYLENFAYSIPEIRRLSYGFGAIAWVRNMETGGSFF